MIMYPGSTDTVKHTGSVKGMPAVRKAVAGFLSLVVLFVISFSICYVALEADHDCCGEDCHICACLDECGNTLQLLRCGYTSALPELSAISYLLIAGAALLLIHVFQKETPVTDKIRLNN